MLWIRYRCNFIFDAMFLIMVTESSLEKNYSYNDLIADSNVSIIISGYLSRLEVYFQSSIVLKNHLYGEDCSCANNIIQNNEMLIEPKVMITDACSNLLWTNDIKRITKLRTLPATSPMINRYLWFLFLVYFRFINY